MTVDVNEGRRLLRQSHEGVIRDGDEELTRWLYTNAAALLDAVEKVEAAVNRLNAASIPLGVTEAQFNEITLRDVRSILVSGVPE